MDNSTYTKTIKKVGIITISLNAFLSFGKLISGIIAKSTSLISDGIHSFSDILSTIIVMIGAKLGKKEADSDHPFGHERLESISSVFLSVILIATALILTYNSVISIINYIKGEVEQYNYISLYIALSFAISSILIKGWMFIYTKKKADLIKSKALKADAYHHLTDSISSIASLGGIIGLLLGNNLQILDPIASILIAIFIIKIAIDILKSSVNELVDKSASKQEIEKITTLVKENKNVLAINSIKTRIFGNKYYIELELAVDDNLTVKQGHEIAKEVHDNIESKIEEVKHCIIHIDPISESNK